MISLGSSKSLHLITLWAYVIDAYEVLRDLLIVKIDEFFYEIELHEQDNLQPKDKDISLIVGQKKSKNKKKENDSSFKSEHKSESEDEDTLREMEHFIKKMMRKSKFLKMKDVKKIL